jgi:hypothetical protein
MAEVTQADLSDMSVEERANTLADTGKGDPWELVGYFREKARQAEERLKAEKEASAKFFAARHRTEAVKPLVEALERMVYEATHLSPCKPNGDHDCTIKADALEQARAALRGAKIAGGA